MKEPLYDLTFGEYIRLFENKDYWKRLNIYVDRNYLIQRLANVRQIRNDIMHFDPNGVDEQQLEELRRTNRLLEHCLVIKEVS
ncbi:MAG TPA: hypothetical protein PLX63_06005 [Rectinema sp.]|nr:hypothetical protein [Rectinema sp.]